MTPSETIASAIQSAWHGEAIPEPGSAARDALMAAILASLNPEGLSDLGVLTIRLLMAHLQADLAAHCELTALQLAIERGEKPAGMCGH